PGRRLKVQRGQFEVEQYGGLWGAAGEVDTCGQSRKCGKASHVADGQTLCGGGHPQVAQQPGVDSRGSVTGRGDKAQQTDLFGTDPGLIEGSLDRFPGQGQTLVLETLHPGCRG